MKNKLEKVVLVYQAGIANVFAVDCFNFAPSGRTEKRLLQADFRTCEAFCRGLAAADVSVASAACNVAGDVARQKWSGELEAQPFSDKFRPVFNKVRADIYIGFLNPDVMTDFPTPERS